MDEAKTRISTRGLLAGRALQSPAPSLKDDPSFNPLNAKILVVDDRPENLALIQSVLGDAGFEQIRCVDASTRAIEEAREYQPDVFLLDVRMPEINGIELQSLFKQEGLSSGRPVLFLTAENDPQVKHDALDGGAWDFIQKPFDLDEIQLKVRNAAAMSLTHSKTQEQQRTLEKFVSAGTRRISRHSDWIRGHLTNRTILFTDLRGFTSFSDCRDPRHVLDVLESSLDAQAAIIAENGGEVDKFVGDAVMAIFSDEASALRAARQIVNALKTNEDFHNIEDFEGALLPGIGIHSGPVIEGVVGNTGLRSYTVIGDAVNTASRLCSLADAGDVVISLEVYSKLAVDNRESFGESEFISIKGKKSRQTLYRQRMLAPAVTDVEVDADAELAAAAEG